MTLLDKALREKGISGAEVARRLRTGESEVCKWKKGLLYVPAKHRETLAELVGVPAEALFDGKGIPK